MFSKTPELYDLIYREFKDYQAEAARVADILRAEAPDARTVLDVGCGTGEHARHLGEEHGYDVAGLDVEPKLVELARQKYPQGDFRQGDMATFELDGTFDAVLCLFGSIAYLRDLDAVEQALQRFRRHLRPGGIVVLEPWIDPDAWQPGRVSILSAASDDVHVVRMSRSGQATPVAELEFQYLIGRPDGIEHRVEDHRLGLFTTGQLREALRTAGLGDVRFDPEGLTGRGLLIARP